MLAWQTFCQGVWTEICLIGSLPGSERFFLFRMRGYCVLCRTKMSGCDAGFEERGLVSRSRFNAFRFWSGLFLIWIVILKLYLTHYRVVGNHPLDLMSLREMELMDLELVRVQYLGEQQRWECSCSGKYGGPEDWTLTEPGDEQQWCKHAAKWQLYLYHTVDPPRKTRQWFCVFLLLCISYV